LVTMISLLVFSLNFLFFVDQFLLSLSISFYHLIDSSLEDEETVQTQALLSKKLWKGMIWLFIGHDKHIALQWPGSVRKWLHISRFRRTFVIYHIV
jgi:hypothetical protein